MQRHVQKHHTGFTLVETLVAITILLLVVIGPMTAAQKGVQNAYYANEQIAATFLAQEAIEAVRELRDTYGLDALLHGGDSYGWIDIDPSDLPNACGPNSTHGCRYDTSDPDLFVECNTTADCDVQYFESTKTYGHGSGGVDSGFNRSMRIDWPSGGSSPNEGEPIEVTVTVSWQSNVLNAAEVVLQTWIYDQYQRYE